MKHDWKVIDFDTACKWYSKYLSSFKPIEDEKVYERYTCLNCSALLCKNRFENISYYEYPYHTRRELLKEYNCAEVIMQEVME